MRIGRLNLCRKVAGMRVVGSSAFSRTASEPLNLVDPYLLVDLYLRSKGGPADELEA